MTTAVLPWGATEAHNYHLPYSTDTVEAESMAAGAAKYAWEKGAKVIVLPAIPFGVNTGQHDVPLRISQSQPFYTDVYSTDTLACFSIGKGFTNLSS